MIDAFRDKSPDRFRRVLRAAAYSLGCLANACVWWLVGVGAAVAQAPRVDWKFFGGVVIESRRSYCFYDNDGLVHQTDKHIRVWSKCLRGSDLDQVDIKRDFGGTILENTAQKVARYYAPPIALVQNIDADQAMLITQYEETADIALIEPVSEIIYELNCADRMERELNITITVRGRRSSQDKPLNWKYVPPEGNVANLLQLLCPRQPRD